MSEPTIDKDAIRKAIKNFQLHGYEKAWTISDSHNWLRGLIKENEELINVLNIVQIHIHAGHPRYALMDIEHYFNPKSQEEPTNG